jgi:hypothetical protein
MQVRVLPGPLPRLNHEMVQRRRHSIYYPEEKMNNTMSSEDFDRYAEKAMASTGGYYLKVPPSQVRYLKGDGSLAIILAFLANLLRLKLLNAKDRQRLRQNDGFFRCSHDYVQRSLGMTKHKTFKAFELFSKKPHCFITKKRRVGNRLWIKINEETLDKMGTPDLPEFETQTEESKKKMKKRRENASKNGRKSGVRSSANRCPEFL